MHARKVVAGVLDAASGEVRIAAVLQAKARRDALDAAVSELAAEPPFRGPAGKSWAKVLAVVRPPK